MNKTLTHTVARITAAIAAAAVISVAGAGSAEALIGGGVGGIGGGGGVIIDPGWELAPDGAINGTVDVGSCNAVPTVWASWWDRDSHSVYPTLVATGGGHYTYSVGGIATGNVTVQTWLPPTACSYGKWTTSSANVAVVNSYASTAPAFVYTMPKKVTTIPGYILASAVRSRLSDFALHLNGHQTAVVSGSHQLNNASTLVAAGTTTNFSIAQTTVDLDPCGVCPDFGDAQFHISNLDSNSKSFSWLPSGALEMTVGFESSGKEIKGYYVNSLITPNDTLIPDAEVDNGKLVATMVPVIDGAGGITMDLSGTSNFSASISPTGGCTYVVYVCNAITNYPGRITKAFNAGATQALRSATLKARMASQIRSALNTYGIGTVKAVYVQGDNITIVE